MPSNEETTMQASNETEKKLSRRSYLSSAGAALLAASALSLGVEAEADQGKNDGDTIYAHGMVWNRDLPGVAEELRLSFDIRVNLQTGVGFGTAEDPVYPDYNIHFAINSATKEKLPGGESRYALKGVVTKANNPNNVGLPIRILAQTTGDATAVAIAIGDQAFAGAGLLVVIAIIAILIGLLQGVQQI